MKYLKLYENFNAESIIYYGISNAILNNNRKLFDGIKSEYNLDLDFDNINYLELAQKSGNVKIVTNFLRDIIKQEGEIYVMPYRIRDGEASFYERRGRVFSYYLNDKVPNPLTPDTSINAEEGDTWTWEEGDLTLGDPKSREYDKKKGHVGVDKWDTPHPYKIKDVIRSIEGEKSSFFDKYVVLDKSGNPIWDIVPDDYVKSLKKHYETNR